MNIQSPSQNKPMEQAKSSRKKFLFMEQFISILLIFRNQLSDLNPFIYYSVIVAFLAGKSIKQGNTAGSPLQYVSLLILIASDLLQSEYLTHFGVMVAVLNYIFISPTVYTLPEYNPKVGIRQNYSKRNNRQLYWMEWFPISQQQKYELYQIPWSHTIETYKMAQYMGIKNKFMLSAFKFFTNHTQKYRLTLAKGTQAKAQGVILFSHGRSGTPFLYSSILKSLARKWRIICPQHSEVPVTPFKDLKDIKRFREIQVKERGSQIDFLTNRVKQDQEIVLMGHSYGCATILQAYHDMHLSIRKRVTHIVLLDPWLFPLPEQVFQDEIVCPILMLSNQHFLRTQDIYERNRSFIKRHSRLLYICWKDGDHLHQTDMGFIVGNSLRRIKNSKQSKEMIQRNIEAIELFLQGKKLSYQQIEKFSQKFRQYDLGKDYKPLSFSNGLNF